jgi:predicted XRE-type DNA-binding protein
MDWQQLLKELAAWGYTQERVATHCGVAQSTVSDLGRGATKSPAYAFGKALEALHATAKRETERKARATAEAAAKAA